MRIDDYRFGRMVVAGTVYTSDLFVYSDRVVDGWWRREGHKLWPSDLETLLAAPPGVLVLGTGAHGVLAVTADARRALDTRGVELVAEPTGSAWRTFNRLAAEDVVGAFHLTC